MKKNLLSLCFILLSSAVWANGLTPKLLKVLKSLHPVGRDTGAVAETMACSTIDTLFVLPSDPSEIPFFENHIYKLRLDSIKSEIPLDYNELVQTHIDLYAFKRRELVSKMMGIGRYYFPIFEKFLKEEGLPLDLKYLPIIESTLKPTAVSRVGATGLWQFMYGTGKFYDLDVNYYIDERRDPIASTIAAVHFLSDLFDRYNDWLLVIAAYNCGPGNIDKAIAKAGGSTDFWQIRPFLPRETANYVPAFIAATYIMTYAPQHNITLTETDFSNETDTVMVDKAISLAKIATVLNVSNDVLTFLNPKYRKHIINATADSPQELILPKQSKDYFASLSSAQFEQCVIKLSKASVANERWQADDEFVRLLQKRKKSHSINYYKVKRGDNLGSIATKHKCSVADLKKWNGLRSSKIAFGQRIKIYSSNKNYLSSTKSKGSLKTYKVKPGDTLSTIAEKFDGMTVEKLKKLNKINNAKSIRPGTTLKVG
ncbi:LysM peptidoglycan-binding domain-containing protein [Solitalea sp. MAHUQ-68]|uniref:LysM peptidoglycan-binding domain-containing protein n=1 Tax=Solitalea agri TaxID=2953739 RepID=A0A9X2F2S7_9SPHI|nr:lytic transglycosylase domain-containing protein [Solitalea agri]MCO4293145.1 LysM peptidoglycan-binding domain-containing protein [Solitalea agri]